jgi:hypothetical protein
MPAAPPLVMTCIDDAIVALDIESALLSAGYRVLRAEPDRAPEVRPLPAVAAIDAGDGWCRALPLVRAMQSRGVPCVVFTTEDRHADIPAEVRAAEWLVKPFAAEDFLRRVASLAAAAGKGNDAWTADAPVGKSANG